MGAINIAIGIKDAWSAALTQRQVLSPTGKMRELVDDSDANSSSSAGGDGSRRLFLNSVVCLGATACLGGMVTPTLMYLWPVTRTGPGAEFARAGQLSQLAIGNSKMIQVDGNPILVIRTGKEEVRAFSPICTHLGCLVQWRKDKTEFFCPCHGGLYNSEGKVIGGPPPRPLPRYPVSIVDGEIKVDLQAESHA